MTSKPPDTGISFGETCKEHEAILCTNHKDRTCRPFPAQPGHCLAQPRR